MNKLLFPLFTLLLFIGFGQTLWSQDLPTGKIEDDSTLRLSLVDTWFRETPGNVLAKMPENYTLRGGSRIQVRVEVSNTNREEFAIILAREQNGSFPGWAQGSWVLTRRLDNNPEGSRIRIFLKSDFNTYIQFRHFNDEKCLMDIVIYDSYVIRSLPVPVPFERLYVLPVEDVLSLAGDRFPRRYFEPQPGMYRDSRSFINAVRSRLPELSFLDDGAINEKGDYVFINTLEKQDLSAQGGQGGLNCSGFAKWIVDGILRPITEEWLPIEPLKAPFGDRGSPFTDIWEESRDPFFGLDW